MYAKFFKRLIDVILSFTALLLLCVPLLVVMLVIRITMGAPVLFIQKRIGKSEKPFNLYKLRSMKNAFDENGVPLPDTERVTGLGKFIRKTSIDELPSLVNILKGDMSIVGPRPLPMNYLPWFKEEERVRHAVRGGLTGLAQIHGRNTSSWETRFRYDAEYVNNITFWGDIKIIFDTIGLVLKKSDIGERGNDAPMDFHVYRSGLSELELLKREKEI